MIWISCSPWERCLLFYHHGGTGNWIGLLIHVENIQSAVPRSCMIFLLYFLFNAHSCTCASAGATATVLYWRMSEVVAHTAIRGDGSVCERVCVWCERDSTEGVFNRARRDRWLAFITAWWVNTCEKLLPALSIKLSSALLSLSSHWPAQRLEDQLRRDERRGSQLFCGPGLSRHVTTKR